MTIGFYEGKFLPFHQGHLQAAITASQYVDQLYVVCGYNSKLDDELCKQDNCKLMSSELRLSWLGHSLKNFKNIKVLGCEYRTDDPVDFECAVPWHRNFIGTHIDVVFSSEPSYGDIFKKLYPEAKHHIIDADRKFVNIHAGMIRKDPFKYWEFMPKIVRSHFVKKILITGIESTGKSLMVEKLAQYFNTIGVQEVGRDYCIEYNNQLTTDHFNEIVMKHLLKQYDALKEANKYLFIDSDAVVSQYYHQKYLKKMSNFIDNIIDRIDYDMTFYLDATVNWVDDGYRFLKHNRMNEDFDLMNLYKYYGKGKEHIHISSNEYNLRFQEVVNLLQNQYF